MNGTEKHSHHHEIPTATFENSYMGRYKSHTLIKEKTEQPRRP